MILSTIANTELLGLASVGNIEAQRKLRDHFAAMSADPACPIEHYSDAFAAAEVFARMAATGRQPEDIWMLVQMLGVRADLFTWTSNTSRDAAAAEVVTLLHELNQAGDIAAAVAMEKMAQLDGAPELFGLASEMMLSAAPDLETVAGAC